MNYSSYQQPEMEINYKGIIWDLLEQWKAVLITALLVMILVAGAKYYKDNSAYDNATREQTESSQAGLSAEERISKILETLPEEERETVEFLVRQSEWIETEKEYMNNSILMNSNPANQRTLKLDYYISIADVSESKMTALVYGYVGHLNNENLIKSVGQAIASNTETKYIAELISVNGDRGGNANNTGNGSSLEINSDADGAVIEVCVVLPDYSDAEAVESAMTSSLTSFTPELNKRIGSHSINLINTSETFIYNAAAVKNHNDIMINIFNLQSNSKNMQVGLSEGQRTAISSIEAIKKDSASPTEKEQIDDNKENSAMSKPGLSKKYALLGFILGAMAYAFVYLILVIIRGRIRYASDVENYTQARLFGEIYNKKEHKGIDKLLNSAFVDKYRYRNKLDSELQSTKIVDALSAACEHAGTKELTVIETGSNEFSKHIDEFLEKAKKQGLKLNRVVATEDIDEKILASSPDVMLIINSGSRISNASKLAALCREYDANILGNVFNGTI